MNARLIAGLGLAVAALGGGGLWFARRSRAPAPAAAVPSASASVARPFASARPNPHPPGESRPTVWPFETAKPRVVPLSGVDEPAPIELTPPGARRAEHARRAAEAQTSAYPPTCRPAVRSMDRILPRHPFPIVRPLSQKGFDRGLALLRATQDRDHLVLGDAVRLTVEVTVDGARVPFEVKAGELRKPGPTPSVPPEVIALVVFRDDGVSPDDAARDGVHTASVVLGAPLDHFVGDLSVRAEISTEKETGEIVFPFVAAGPAPAEFSGAVREAVEDGSLALYVGVRVRQAGQYDVTGRLYDGERRAMAVVDTSAALSPSTREVRLEVCGRVLRDEGVAGPWELRDVEGYLRGTIGDRPDLVPMKILKGPHRTRVYPLDTFQ